ncbi:hypothetical protein [Kitasatospora purpeofusca]|uniref:hypothetical protein n=1 Tax=Kitasatospora purpeofusca TaxID=67352 RepID=UPI0036AC36D7
MPPAPAPYHQPQARRAMVAMFAGATVSILLAASTGAHALVIAAIVLLVAAVVTLYRIDPYASWAAWAAGSAISMLLTWLQPGLRPALLPVSGLQLAVAAALYLLLRVGRRTGGPTL